MVLFIYKLENLNEVQYNSNHRVLCQCFFPILLPFTNLFFAGVQGTHGKPKEIFAVSYTLVGGLSYCQLQHAGLTDTSKKQTN